MIITIILSLGIRVIFNSHHRNYLHIFIVFTISCKFTYVMIYTTHKIFRMLTILRRCSYYLCTLQFTTFHNIALKLQYSNIFHKRIEHFNKSSPNSGGADYALSVRPFLKKCWFAVTPGLPVGFGLGR